MDNWKYSTIHKSACKVVDEQTLWGQTVSRVWLPNQDAVVRVLQSELLALATNHSPLTTNHILYVSAAAKVAEVLEGSSSVSDRHVLLAPMESNVIPLPHQIHALSRAISGDRVRYLLADEVGLGKTIEAGLVMRELKLRGLVRRTLVVAPKSLAMPGLTVCGAFAGELAARLNARVVEPTMPLSVAIALIAASRAPSPDRPAPLYLRPPDAAPARDLPPTIIA